MAVLDIDAEGAASVVEAITSQGGQPFAVQADIANRDQVCYAVQRVRSAFGPVTNLVNNAAVEIFMEFEDIDSDSWDRLMAVNLKGAYIVTQSVLPDMKTAKWGRIVNISATGRAVGCDADGALHRGEGRGDLHEQVPCH